MLLRLIIVLSITAFTSLNAEAASLTIVPSGTGSYTVTGDGMDGVAGIDIQLQYDPAIVSSPAVIPGNLISGAMMAANTNIKGSIRIAIISTRSFSGSGTVASISFASRKASGGIISVSASAIDTKGAPVKTLASLAGQGSPPAENGQLATPEAPASENKGAVNANPVAASPAATVATEKPSATASPASVTTGTSILGTVTMPSEVPEETTAASEEPIPLPVPEPEPEPEPEPKPEPEPAAAMTHKGVMDHFRTLSGEKTPASCIALFKQEFSSTISQKPPIAISDGTTPVIIVAALNSQKASPNFALSNAKLVSISKSGDSWIIKALPQAQAIQASLTILSGESLEEFPLTLVPPAGNLPLTKADFAAFLKDSGVTPPKRDLNNDGIHDYQDDYIYTAHYLIGTSAEAERKDK